ncbi:hypothetical protein, partial [Bosea sp. Tri-44]|uniref:hypothetical protein n=1 Tax=Bosea sp. Tri-44 TaxID=1972137 RepID=UPI0019D6D35B
GYVRARLRASQSMTSGKMAKATNENRPTVQTPSPLGTLSCRNALTSCDRKKLSRVSSATGTKAWRQKYNAAMMKAPVATWATLSIGDFGAGFCMAEEVSIAGIIQFPSLATPA